MAANSRFAMATHIMTALAIDPSKRLSSSYLADSVNTNPVVVRRLLSDLQKAGLIETQTGKAGGAQLARKASAINLYEIYAAADDGSVFAYNPNDPNRQCELSCVMKSVLEPVFQAAEKALIEELKSFRLSQLVEKMQSKCSAAKK